MKVYELQDNMTINDYLLTKGTIVFVGENNYFNNLGKRFILKKAKEVSNIFNIDNFDEDKVAYYYNGSVLYI